MLPFDDGALAIFHFRRNLHKSAHTVESLEAGWLGKGRGTIARLTAALTLLAWSERDEPMPPVRIERELAQQAIGMWSHYFRPHAQNVFGRVGFTDRDRSARRVVR